MNYLKFIVILVVAGFACAENKKVAEPVRERVEKFTELKLHGQLKRPELSYSFEDQMRSKNESIDLPQNFDNEIIRDNER